jgi:hypothetical protein
MTVGVRTMWDGDRDPQCLSCLVGGPAPPGRGPLLGVVGAEADASDLDEVRTSPAGLERTSPAS